MPEISRTRIALHEAEMENERLRVLLREGTVLFEFYDALPEGFESRPKAWLARVRKELGE